VIPFLQSNTHAEKWGLTLAVRFTFFEAVYTILVAVGGLTALAADRLGVEWLKNAGILTVILGVIVFGLDMVIHRRAEIGTRYSSSINPAFQVFRGFGAVEWGIVFIVIGLLFIGYMYIWLTGWTDAQKFFSDHNGIVVALVGLVVTAWGAGSATSAMYRSKKSERTARRRGDRLVAIILIVPLGLAISSWGLIKTFAPSIAEAAKGSTLQWLGVLVKRIAN